MNDTNLSVWLMVKWQEPEMLTNENKSHPLRYILERSILTGMSTYEMEKHRFDCSSN